MPSGSEGFVTEDLDLVVRLFGAKYNTDATGKFMLIELKHGNAQPAIAQQKTFGLIDSLLRKADPNKQRYLGYFILNYDNEDWNKANFRVNGKPYTLRQLTRFLQDQRVDERDEHMNRRPEVGF
jgi:hypothetical protein